MTCFYCICYECYYPDLLFLLTAGEQLSMSCSSGNWDICYTDDLEICLEFDYLNNYWDCYREIWLCCLKDLFVIWTGIISGEVSCVLFGIMCISLY